jgi:hypothetical protein
MQKYIVFESLVVIEQELLKNDALKKMGKGEKARSINHHPRFVFGFCRQMFFQKKKMGFRKSDFFIMT